MAAANHSASRVGHQGRDGGWPIALLHKPPPLTQPQSPPCHASLPIALGIAERWIATTARAWKESTVTRRKTCIANVAPYFPGIAIRNIQAHHCEHWLTDRGGQAGVDIPTVSRWLGHKDGGALAMRVYGHLRNEHSTRSIALVKF